MWFSHEIIRDAENDAYFLIREREQRFQFGGKTAGYSAMSKEAVWRAARSQHLVVLVEKIDGTQTDLGHVFDPQRFERAAYFGYVSYGLSMTDGVFHPLSFDQWVIHFRKNVLADDASPSRVWAENDAPQYVKDALHVYTTQLQRATKS